MLPLILAGIGGWLIGDSMKDKQVFADGGIVEKKVITDGDDTWYLTYSDSTHFFLSNSPDFKGNAYHIGQFRGKPYYEEVNQWLLSNNKYADGGMMKKGGYVIIGGGDRYDGGLAYSIQKEDGEIVKEGILDGDDKVSFKGKKYDGLAELAEDLGAKIFVNTEYKSSKKDEFSLAEVNKDAKNISKITKSKMYVFTTGGNDDSFISGGEEGFEHYKDKESTKIVSIYNNGVKEYPKSK